jgi:sugar lactone lactonase YvrE
MSGPVEVEAQPFIDGIIYGEGPRWHEGRLWFTDGFAGKVYSVGEAGDVTVEAAVAKASGLGWLPNGTLVVSTLMDAKIHHIDSSGNVTTTFDYTDIAWSTNDILVAPDGRTYVDLYGAEGAIGLVGEDGAIRIVATGLTRPNCLALLSDGSTLVVGDSDESRIFAFPTEPDGSLGTPTVFADLGSNRHPDGLCVDVEDGVWVGCFDTGEFLRVVAGGAVTHRVSIDRGWAIAPALGGTDGRTLFMVVDETTIERFVRRESTGWIMQARVDVSAAGSP